MKTFQCSAIERNVVSIQVEAENKQEAANKAMKLFEEHGALVLFESVGGMWTGPEDPDFDEEIEVTMELDDGPPYWDDAEFFTVDCERR